MRDLDWLRRGISPDANVAVTDVTSGEAVISLMGPRSRDLLASMSDADLSNDGFPFGTAREIDLGLAIVRAARITYVGELGWELYIPTEFATHVYDEIAAAGDAFGLRHAGYHALNSLRIEKAYRHWGHDMSDEDTALEAGLGFTVAWDKPGGFVGREALLRQRERAFQAAGGLHAGRSRTAHLPQRADLARRRTRRPSHLRRVRPHGRALDRARVHPVPGRTADDRVAGGRLVRGGDRHRAIRASASFRAPYDPSNARIRS